MSFRKFSSGLKKKLKRRLRGGRHEQDGIGPSAGGERVDSMGPHPQPEHHVIAEGERDRAQSGNEADADEGRVDSADPTRSSDGPVSESRCDGGGRECGTEGTKVSERGSHLGLGVEHVMKSGPSRGGSDVGGENVGQPDAPPSTPLISQGEDSESMQPRIISVAASDHLFRQHR